MIEWYFVFLAFVPGYSTIDTVGPFATKEQCQIQRQAVREMTTKRLLGDGYANARANIKKDVKIWGCYQVPDPKKKD